MPGAEYTRDERLFNQHENPYDAMSDDNSHSSDTVNSKKGFFSLLLSQLFHGEPKNRDELLALIRDSGQNDLIDEDTRDMLEGVMDIADQRVRDIMIPRSQMITLKRNQTLDECLDVIIESAHSRFPVISEDKDHIEGILMVKICCRLCAAMLKPSAWKKCCARRLSCPKASGLTAC